MSGGDLAFYFKSIALDSEVRGSGSLRGILWVSPAPPPDPDIPGTALVTRFFVCGRGNFFVFLPFIFGFCMTFVQVG